MLRSEYRKMLCCRRGVLILIFFLLFELFSLSRIQPYNRTIEERREEYDLYIEQFRGTLTEEKRNEIEEEMSRMLALHREFEQLKQSYYFGRIPSEEYRSGFERLLPEEERYLACGEFYKQYMYVRESSERSLLYTGGWELLFRSSADLVLILVLVLLLTPVFCSEYSTGMDKLLLVQAKSAYRLPWVKVFASLTVSAGLFVLREGIRFCFIAARYGVSDGGFALQSLMTFGTTEKQLSIRQAYLLDMGARLGGYLTAAVWVLFFSVLMRKYAIALMASLAALPLPLLAIKDLRPLARLPLPWACLSGGMYLNGTVVSPQMEGSERILWKETTPGELRLLLFSALGIAAVMLAYVGLKNTNLHRRRLSRPSAGGIAVLLLCLAFPSCGSRETEKLSYNRRTADYYQNDRITIMDGKLSDRRSGKTVPFPVDPFSEATEEEALYNTWGAFAASDSLWYIRRSENSAAQLIRMNTHDLSEKILYEWADAQKWFFGLFKRNSEETNPRYIRQLLVFRNGIFYFGSTDKNLYRLDLLSGKGKLLLEIGNDYDVAFDGQVLYYSDRYGRIVSYDFTTGESTPHDRILAKAFYLDQGIIYYANLGDKEKIYRWDCLSETGEKLSEISAYSICADREYLWVSTRSGERYRLERDGRGETEITEEGYYHWIPYAGEVFYLESYDNTTDQIVISAIDKKSLCPVEKRD